MNIALGVLRRIIKLRNSRKKYQYFGFSIIYIVTIVLGRNFGVFDIYSTSKTPRLSNFGISVRNLACIFGERTASRLKFIARGSVPNSASTSASSHSSVNWTGDIMHDAVNPTKEYVFS